MIDSKYAMQYSMPHSVVHIVDNSVYQGELPTSVADDPSLYATIVVTGTPMGEDNKVIKVTRSDIAAAAFGLGTGLTNTDRKRFGQCVDYPLSLISQNVPVQLLRVTPDDASYAVGVILVQWKKGDDNKFHVRYKQGELPENINLVNYKTKKALNNAIVKQTANKVDDWNQAVFCTFISAGRGSEYNNFSVAINLTQQNKKPANVKYEFVTIDRRISSSYEIERFTGSLINEANYTRTDYIESVNNVVSQRVAGSSIVVPFINEDVVRVIYNEYSQHLRDMITSQTIVSEYDHRVETFLSLNTFDVIYGNFIYDGTDTDKKLPYFQADMLDTNVPKLSDSYLVSTVETGWDVTYPAPLHSALLERYYYGLTRRGNSVNIGTASNPVYGKSIEASDDSTHVGNMYLSASSTSTSKGNTYITFVSSINQITGSVTTVNISKFYPLKEAVVDEENVTTVDTTATSKKISLVVGESTSLKSLVIDGKINVGDIIAKKVNASSAVSYYETFKLYYVSAIDSATNIPTLMEYTAKLIRLAFDWSSTVSGNTGIGNVVGRTINDNAFKRPGAVVISEDGSIYVNDYNVNQDATAFEEAGRIKIPDELADICFFGTCPSAVAVSSDLLDISYDVLVYPADGTDSTKILEGSTPKEIHRYVISNAQGSIFRVLYNPIEIPADYYNADFGMNLSSELGGISLSGGSTGFFDDTTINDIEFKWRYSQLLVKAYKGLIDPRIKSPTRVPAKFLFDGGHNTVIGTTVSTVGKDPIDIISASTIFTEDEKEDILLDNSLLANIVYEEGVDVKQAMYDFMVERCYMGIPEDKRPVGPGSGLQLYLDAGVTDANTAILMNTSFTKRFNNPNAVWDIGGYVAASTGLEVTYVKRIVDNLFTHINNTSLNKPFKGSYTSISPSEYISYFPDIDTTEWERRELMYKSGGNIWFPDVNGNIQRRSQRTLYRDAETSDLIQESNMRTLSQLVYIIQNYIDGSLLEYDDDGVIKTMEEDINNRFSGWVGNLVSQLSIRFSRDKNTDGGDILICYVDVTFRGLILRVPIIVNVNARTDS